MSAIHHSTFNSTVSYTDLVHVFVYLYKLCTSNSSFGNQLAEKHHLSNTNVISKTFRRSDWRCSVKKLFLKVSQNSQKKQPCRSLSFLLKLQASRFQTSMPTVLKKTPTQVFSCQYCEILWTASFIEHVRWLPPYSKDFQCCCRILEKNGENFVFRTKSNT